MTNAPGKSNGNGANPDEPLLEFPCRFPIKAMGRDEDDFEAHVLEIVSAQVGRIDADDISVRPSRAGRFVSVTVTFEATSRDQLDAVYRALSASVRILYLL